MSKSYERLRLNIFPTIQVEIGSTKHTARERIDNFAWGSISPQIVAAERLRDAGFPGIKYLDQGSRGAGNGSHNSVVFNDKNIAILKKYGLAGLGIGAGGAAMMGQNQPAQASGVSLTPVQGNPFAQ